MAERAKCEVARGDNCRVQVEASQGVVHVTLSTEDMYMEAFLPPSRIPELIEALRGAKDMAERLAEGSDKVS